MPTDDADFERQRAERREHIDAAEAEARKERAEALTPRQWQSSYEAMLDSASAVIGHALTHQDCPDYHRAKLQQLRDELDGMYGAVISNKGEAPADAPAPSRPLFGPWKE